MARVSLSVATPYPASSMACTSSSTGTSPAFSLTDALSVARLTVASSTPGTSDSARVTWETQEAQVIPVMGRVILSPAVVVTAGYLLSDRA